MSSPRNRAAAEACRQLSKAYFEARCVGCGFVFEQAWSGEKFCSARCQNTFKAKVEKAINAERRAGEPIITVEHQDKVIERDLSKSQGPWVRAVDAGDLWAARVTVHEKIKSGQWLVPCPSEGDKTACEGCWSFHEEATPYCTTEEYRVEEARLAIRKNMIRRNAPWGDA